MYSEQPPGYQQGYAPMAPQMAIPLQPVARARPFFPGGPRSAMNNINGFYPECCCGLRPGVGPNVPPHWYDGGDGWATAHFMDVQPVDLDNEQPGRHRCKLCHHEVQAGSFCCGPCWQPAGNAPREMAMHLMAHHGMVAPPKRQWATELCDTEGCLDSCCCWQCQASRQLMATHGFANQLNLLWVCLFMSASRDDHPDGRAHNAFLSYAAYQNRRAVKELHNIDEGFCGTLLTACCCPVCSLAQTYRELSAGGVWPGGVCNGNQPPAIAMNLPPPHLAMAMGGAAQPGYKSLS